MKSKKTYRIYSLTILGIVLVIGTSFAWFVWQSPTNTDISITISGMQISYNGGNDITGANLVPTNDKTNTQEAITKTFSISTTNTYTPNARFLLNLNTLPTELQDSSFKWELYKDDIMISRGDFASSTEGTQTVLQTNQPVSISPQIDTYTLYIYIDASMDNPSSMGNKSFNFSLIAEASQGRYQVSIGDNLKFQTDLPNSNVITDNTNDKNIRYQGGGCSNWAEVYKYTSIAGSFAGLEQCISETLQYCVSNWEKSGYSRKEECQRSISCSVTNEVATYTSSSCTDINNYVTFNNELWRIIGMFSVNDLTTGEPVSNKLIKIIRSEPLEAEMQWGNSNNWNESDIYIYLNDSSEGYLSQISTTEQLDEIIKKTRWNLGSYSNPVDIRSEEMNNQLPNNQNKDLQNSTLSYKNNISKNARKLAINRALQNLEIYNTIMDPSNSNSTYNDNYIGLMNPSDYAYSGTSRELKTNNWLYLGQKEWTLTPSLTEMNVNIINIDGSIVSNIATDNRISFRPVTYIPASTIIQSGIGSKTDPYIIKTNIQILR